MKSCRFLVTLLALLPLSGCGGGYVIPEDDMAGICHEMYLLDGYLSEQPDFRAQTDSMYAYLPVLAKYGYTVEQYLEALDQYLRNCDDFIDVLDRVKERLQAEIEEVVSEIDSLDGEIGSDSDQQLIEIPLDGVKKGRIPRQALEKAPRETMEQEPEHSSPSEDTSYVKVTKIDAKTLKRLKKKR